MPSHIMFSTISMNEKILHIIVFVTDDFPLKTFFLKSLMALLLIMYYNHKDTASSS